ncbi:hypothetical protein VNO77_22881 [Canavalia gladiata]|uniref:Uncharacterized protein n=1 Tax=Canavalia gladiata TaxID=3824 RepID=A0AAN9L602_CANGL
MIAYGCAYDRIRKEAKDNSNILAMHDILYRWLNLDNCDHLEFPRVVLHTFIYALFVSIIVDPFMLIASLLHCPKFYALPNSAAQLCTTTIIQAAAKGCASTRCLVQYTVLHYRSLQLMFETNICKIGPESTMLSSFQFDGGQANMQEARDLSMPLGSMHFGKNESTRSMDTKTRWKPSLVVRLLHTTARLQIQMRLTTV